MRILVMTVVHDPQDARIRHRQMKSLLEAGHQVTFAAPFTAYSREAPEGARAVDLPRAVGRRRARAAVAARRVLRREAPGHDLVLLHDPELLLALPGQRGLPPVVWDVHEDTAAAVSMKQYVPGPLRRAASWAVLRAEAVAEKRVHLTLAEYGYDARFARRHPVVPNTVPVPADVPPPPGDDRVVYLGRITRQRGGLEMVALASLLPPGVTLELVGPADPDVRPAVQAAADAGLLRWHGFVPNDVALQLLQGATAGISLLHDEPNYAHSRFTKLMEYMANGVPVVTTANPAAAAMVREHDAGLVVPFDDVPAVAAAIQTLIDDRELRERLGRNGRATAVAELDWKVSAAAFVSQLEAWARTS
ncbi:MAG TPA: glycosyltransferase family 4 protein [Actinomycetales bacterium]